MAADWIRDLCESPSRSHKERVIERALIAYRLGSASAECFLYNCYLAYNPNFKYRCKSVPTTKNLAYKENPWTAFWGVLEMLRTDGYNSGRGQQAIDIMSQRFDSEQWNTVCRRVILKDLRCGINTKTLNKVLGNTEWRIPE